MNKYIGRKVEGTVSGVDGFVGVVVDSGITVSGNEMFTFETKWCQVKFLEINSDKGSNWQSVSARRQKKELFNNFDKKLNLLNERLYGTGIELDFVD